MKDQSLVTILSALINYDKQGVQSVSDAIVEEFRSGRVSDIDFMGQLEFLVQAFSSASDVIRGEMVDSLLRSHGDALARKGVKNRMGHEVKVAELGTKYDYSNTPRWVEMNRDTQQAKALQTELELQLKTLKNRQTVIDPETGELIEMNPPIKSSKTGIKVSIPKVL